MEKRTLIFLALSFVILAFYPMALEHFYPNYYKNTPRSSDKNRLALTSQNSSTQSASKLNTQNVAALPDKLSHENDQNFENNNIKFVFNRIGGAIHKVSFPKYSDSDTGKPLLFLSLEGPAGNATLVQLLDTPAASGASVASYDIQKTTDGKLEASAVQQSIKIKKTYTFKNDDYSGGLNIQFENTSASPVEFRYQLFAGSSILPRHSIDSQYIEGNFFSKSGEKTSLKHIKESKLGKSVSSESSVDWVAIKDRHFSVVIKPMLENSFTGLVEGLGNHHFSVSLVSQKIALQPGGSIGQDFLVYFGPNELKELTPAKLDPLVNFGKLDAIGKFLVGSLEMLHKVCKSYGLSIIILTVLINVLLFPLTQVSYMSMKRMQLIQPQMNKLREQYKKNPEKLNKEMMELYKKHKVNPFGGCLPMVLQMPVFIALYVALSKSVILINSQFIWIKDLSSPDKLGLPFALPMLGKEVHLLPLIMVAGMFFQQKLTQIKMEGQDPAMESQQKMMTVIMPVMFGFIFYSMPSGLVLYWLTNTIIMTSYQLYLKRVTLN
jgi:YidC/Oxa1 family membrane protein insertase